MSASTEEKKLVKTGTKVERDEKGRILPGQESLNPSGRPEGTLSLVSILKQLLQEIPKGQKDSVAVELMKEAIKKAKGRDVTMLRDIINRVDGMPKQSVEHGGKDGEPIQVNIVDYRDAPKGDESENPLPSGDSTFPAGVKPDGNGTAG